MPYRPESLVAQLGQAASQAAAGGQNYNAFWQQLGSVYTQGTVTVTATAIASSSNWIYYPTTNAVIYGNVYTSYGDYAESPEQRVARVVKSEAAESRAEQLLFTMLNEQQARDYIEKGYFETEINDKIYRLKKGRAQNVELIEKGRPVLRLCAHPRDWTPNADAVLSQLLMLRTDEKRFLETANKTRLYL